MGYVSIVKKLDKGLVVFSDSHANKDRSLQNDVHVSTPPDFHIVPMCGISCFRLGGKQGQIGRNSVLELRGDDCNLTNIKEHA